MAPSEIGADQHHKVGLIKILVGTGHRVSAEGTLVTGNRRRHAKPRVRVDVGRADEPLHQLVGDVVILGQKLPRDIEGNTIRAVRRNRVAKAVCHQLERLIPPGFGSIDARSQQPVIEADRFAKRRAL